MSTQYGNVAHRARDRCEYCHAPQVVFNSTFEVEHIVPSSRGGGEDLDNLALACRPCNVYKSDNLTGEDGKTPLFHPRADRWEDHFEVDCESATIIGRTDVGRATIARLKMNRDFQRGARKLWMQLGLFP